MSAPEPVFQFPSKEAIALYLQSYRSPATYELVDAKIVRMIAERFDGIRLPVSDIKTVVVDVIQRCPSTFETECRRSFIHEVIPRILAQGLRDLACSKSCGRI